MTFQIEVAPKILIWNNIPIIKVKEEGRAKQMFRKRGIQQSLSLGMPEGKKNIFTVNIFKRYG